MIILLRWESHYRNQHEIKQVLKKTRSCASYGSRCVGTSFLPIYIYDAIDIKTGGAAPQDVPNPSFNKVNKKMLLSPCGGPRVVSDRFVSKFHCCLVRFDELSKD